MSDVTGETYDRFVDRAGEYGVDVTRVSTAEASATIEDLVTSPAVGAPLPWDDVSLPEGVTTDPTPNELDASVTGVTAAALAIADYGSIVLRATPEGTEPVSLFPDHHVAVLRERDVVADMTTAFEWFGDEFRSTSGSAVIATGPSATADMGKLVKGAHGPKDVSVVVVQ